MVRLYIFPSTIYGMCATHRHTHTETHTHSLCKLETFLVFKLDLDADNQKSMRLKITHNAEIRIYLEIVLNVCGFGTNDISNILFFLKEQIINETNK